MMHSTPTMEPAPTQQWQLCQLSPCAPQPTAPGVEVWICSPPAMTYQHPHPTMVMMQAGPQPYLPANNLAMNGAPPGCHYIGGEVAMGPMGIPLQCNEGHGGMSQGYAAEPCLWQPVASAAAAEPMPQLVLLTPVCSTDASSMYSPAPWHQAPHSTTVNFGEFAPAAAAEASVAPQTSVSHMPFAPKCVSLELALCQQEPPPESMQCQIFPKHNLQQLQPEWADYAEQTPESMPEWLSSVDELSECGIARDALFDVEATPRDSKSYASSEASTTISRSARRRRGRRAAKAKAVKASIVIIETPAPEDLLVTEEKKEELIRQLDAGGESARRAVRSMFGSVLRMSLEPFGCRVMQKALDVASTSEREVLAAELHNNVRLAISSPHANFVIQKVIEVLPISATSFVADELATFAAEVARHRFGCRVLSRLVEHHLCGNGCAASSTDVLIDAVLTETDQLIHHNFARHVLELIIEHGTDAHKQRIAECIRKNLFHYAKNRFASYVVEKALILCNAADIHAIASELLSDPERFLMLAMHECGTHVVKAVVKSIHAESAQRAKELLLADARKLKSSKYGKRLLDEV